MDASQSVVETAMLGAKVSQLGNGDEFAVG